ncbi:MAG: hypothetical protein U1F43_13935 [Myxococcota bacterium]
MARQRLAARLRQGADAAAHEVARAVARALGVALGVALAVAGGLGRGRERAFLGVERHAAQPLARARLGLGGRRRGRVPGLGLGARLVGLHAPSMPRVCRGDQPAGAMATA